MNQEKKLQLRLPADLHQWIVQAAKENNRSMNGQMVWMLRGKMQEQTPRRDAPA